MVGARSTDRRDGLARVVDQALLAGAVSVALWRIDSRYMGLRERLVVAGVTGCAASDAGRPREVRSARMPPDAPIRAVGPAALVESRGPRARILTSDRHSTEGGLVMKSSRAAAKRPGADDTTIAPVTIFDAEGRVVRVVPAAEFQRAAAAAHPLAGSGAPGAPMAPGRLARAARASAAPGAVQSGDHHAAIVAPR
jgi:hypothetical protein